MLRKGKNKKKGKVDRVSKVNTPATIGFTAGRYGLGPCHEEPKEVVPGLYLGGRYAASDMARMGLEVLVPLADLDGAVWETGWRGEILYVPIEDFGALPQDVLACYANRVADLVRAGRRVGVFCHGGHGRTGYFAAAVLGLLKPEEDPVQYLRQVYCQKAVETEEQLASLVEFLGRPELAAHAPSKGGLFSLRYTHTSNEGEAKDKATASVEGGDQTCLSCAWLYSLHEVDWCDWSDTVVRDYRRCPGYQSWEEACGSGDKTE